MCVKEFEEIFDEKLVKAKCLIFNIKKIFDCYFADTFPFSAGEKKHEFPDAFALISIEEWCIEQDKRCYVFSKDTDFHGYNSEHLIIEKEFEEYLDETLIKIEDEKNTNRLNLVHEAYKRCKDELISEIEQWLTDELEDESTYYRCFNYFEIHNIDIEEKAVELEEYQIVSVTDSTISIETQANIVYEVVVEADDENSGYYDSEDKVWHSLGTETRTISDNTYITIMLKADIPIAGDDFLDIEISEINEGNQLKLPGKYYN